jgi:predicted PurR-regulated permease PerM
MMERDRPRDDPPTRIIRHELSLRSAFSVIAIAAVLWLVVQIWQIILLLIMALILAGTVSPILSWLERHHIPRAIALGLILVVLVLAIAGLGALVIPALVTQVGALATSAPTIQGRLADYLASVPALAGSAGAVRSVQPQQLLEPLATSALTFAGAAAQVVILGLTTVVLAFYLIADAQRVKGFAFALLPRRFHLRAARILLEMVRVVGGYVRGQALTSLLIGLFVFAVLWLVGTPAPLALAVFAAFADLIPLVGGVLVLAPVVLATLSQGVVPTVIAALLITGYMQVENHVLIPRIYGQTLRLSPLAVLVALLIGGQLLGIIGALLALPIAASLRVLVEQLRIDLPGEQPGEDAQRTLDAEAEVTYAEQTAGVSALDAVAVATSMAEEAQEEEQTATGRVELPIEERVDPARSRPEGKAAG